MKYYLFCFSYILILVLSAGTVSAQRALTAFPLIKNDTNYLAFYSTAGQSSNSKFEFAADLQGNTLSGFDPTEYGFALGTSSGYSVDGYYMAGSQIFAIPVCWQDSSLNMFILANSLANDFEVLYYSGVDGQPVIVVNPEVLELGFCGIGSEGIARVDANNGLSVQGDTLVQLGGTLIKNTNIRLAQYVFSIQGGPPGVSPSFTIGNNEIQFIQGGFSGGNNFMRLGSSNPAVFSIRNYQPSSDDYYEFGMNSFSDRATLHFFKDGEGRTSTFDLFKDGIMIRSDSVLIIPTSSAIYAPGRQPGDPYLQLAGLSMYSQPLGQRYNMYAQMNTAVDPVTKLVGLTDDDQLTPVSFEDAIGTNDLSNNTIVLWRDDDFQNSTITEAGGGIINFQNVFRSNLSSLSGGTALTGYFNRGGGLTIDFQLGNANDAIVTQNGQPVKFKSFAGVVISNDTDIDNNNFMDDAALVVRGNVNNNLLSIQDTSQTEFFGVDINGNTKIKENQYLNWGNTSGTTGYGFRDNSGNIEVKNSGGEWLDIGNITNTVASNTAGSTTISLDLDFALNRVVQIDMTSASTASPITFSVSNAATAGVYTLHFQNVNAGGHDIDFPTSFLKSDGTAWDESTTVAYSSDEWLTCYYDGTNFYCK